ncbi:MAG: hypothetical protein CM15mP88_1450 [Pseudomonadota bacterium]|nr:MAG: hypothetical protein CM15mP88_1450 [Pseudomonadota bacterium]
MKTRLGLFLTTILPCASSILHVSGTTGAGTLRTANHNLVDVTINVVVIHVLSFLGTLIRSPRLSLDIDRNYGNKRGSQTSL